MEKMMFEKIQAEEADKEIGLGNCPYYVLLKTGRTVKEKALCSALPILNTRC